MDTVRLRRLNRWQAEDLSEDLAELFVESSVAAPGEEFRGREEFLRRLADGVRLPGFDMLIAETEALAFAITETLVHPHERTRGLARRLQEHLLADHESSLGVTLVDPSHGAARAAFKSWGWQEVGQVRRSLPGPPVLRALVLPLGQRTAEHPDGLAHNDRTQRSE